MFCAVAPNLLGGVAGCGAARLRGMNAASVRAHPSPSALPGEEGAAGPPGSAGRGQGLWE